MAKTKHGYFGTKVYKLWGTIKYRCYNSNYRYYHRYGGRGIIVCDEWKNDALEFITWALANGYEEGLSIDRIDNDGNYEPINCRFVTAQVNNLNRALPKSNKSGYRGISWNNTDKCWKACLQYNKVMHNIGNFKNIEDAIVAYNNYIIINGLPTQLAVEPKDSI
jgi:hypothetical protein